MLTTSRLTPPACRAAVADADITTAIERLFTTQKEMNEHLLDVATHEGLVMLTGCTDNRLARQRAEEIALAVRGVGTATQKDHIMAIAYQTGATRMDAHEPICSAAQAVSAAFLPSFSSHLFLPDPWLPLS